LQAVFFCGPKPNPTRNMSSHVVDDRLQMENAMPDAGQSRYDRTTLVLHAALAMGVVVEVALQSVMHVPAGVGLGVRDWHREAFEIHARIGPTVAVICLLHWLWICLPYARPGVGYLFPWLRKDGRAALRRDFAELGRLKLPARKQQGALAGTVQGLGLSAVTGSVVGGMISYLGYFVGVPISAHALHLTAWEQVIMAWFVWAFLIGHVSMALLHWTGGLGLIHASGEGASADKITS
jgi:cytochrome b561